MTKASPAPSLSQILAAWTRGVTAADVPANVRAQVIATVVDTVGLSLSARHEGYTVAARDSWDADGPCTAFGHARRMDAGGAAFVNGIAAHGEDFDNTFEGCPVHSGAVIVPAVLALAERDGLSGAQALASMTVGVEVICRLGLVAQKGVHAAGFHPTSILGTMAAALACGHAMGLDEAKLTHALGIAGSAASGIIEYLADGSSTKRMHAGWAAQAGLRAAMLARAVQHRWATRGYELSSHPVQDEARATVAAWGDLDVHDVALAVDGCGVPVFGLPLANMALSYARLVQAAQRGDDGPARVVGAMTGNPFLVGGSDRFDTLLMEATEGRVLCKIGAEGVHMLALVERGIGLAIKVEDGSQRAQYHAVVALLELLDAAPSVWPDGMRDFTTRNVRNTRGEQVGEIVIANGDVGSAA